MRKQLAAYLSFARGHNFETVTELTDLHMSTVRELYRRFVHTVSAGQEAANQSLRIGGDGVECGGVGGRGG